MPPEQPSSLFPDEASKLTYIRRITRKRPVGWGGRSNSPYYRESYAKAIQRDIDMMISTREPILYRYSKHCGPESGISTKTLYLKINQAMMYLLEELDKDGKYKEWRSVVEIHCKKGLGVMIEFTRLFRENFVKTSEDLTADFINQVSPNEVEPERIPAWRRKMNEWLESDDVKPYHQTRLAISEEEIREIKIELSVLSNIEFEISSSSLSIVKMDIPVLTKEKDDIIL
jgi:hypothetical protein